MVALKELHLKSAFRRGELGCNRGSLAEIPYEVLFL